MYQDTLCVPKSVYPIEVVLKAAYSFLDVCYLHIGEKDDRWIISFRSKRDTDSIDAAGAFENELISQAVRLAVYHRTHTIREVLLARAMSSSMIETGDSIYVEEDSNDSVSDEELDSILTNWFDTNG